MKKTFLASAIALAVGSAASVQAQTITITEMKFSTTSLPSVGTINSNGNGSVGSNFTFLGDPWGAEQQIWFETNSSIIIWAGTGTFSNTSNASSDFSYTFHLTGNQVAAGIFFDWSTTKNIPILTIFDCPISGGGVCTGNSLDMVTGPFLGYQFDFNGTTNDDFPSGSVPVPAAVWLMGSGLLGLIGLARRKA